MALARRASALTATEFSERWRSHAGHLGPKLRSAGVTSDSSAPQLLVIPADVRGLAYIQNHPLPRAGGEWAYDAVNEVPEQLRSRTLAVRAFDADAMMIGFELADGRELEAAIQQRFDDPRAAYLHVHYAAPGCYAARVDRAQ